MKAIKKVLSLALCATMLTSAFAFSGCDNPSPSSPGAVSGNYVEMTAENEKPVKDFLQKAANNSSQLDPTKDDFKMGFSLDSDLDFKMKSPASEFNPSQDVSLGLDLSAKFLFSKAAETASDSIQGLDVKAALNLGFDMSSKMAFGEESMETSMNADADLYMDNVGTYVGATAKMKESGTESSQSMYMKFNTLELLAYVSESIGSGALPGLGGDVLPLDVAMEEPALDLETLLTSLEELGLKTYFDLNDNGLKLKVSVTEEMVLSLINQSEDAPESLNIKACTLNLYLVFDKDGNFNLMTLDANINIDVDGGSVLLKGYFRVEISDSIKVNLPKDLATDPKYIESSIEDLLG